MLLMYIQRHLVVSFGLLVGTYLSAAPLFTYTQYMYKIFSVTITTHPEISHVYYVPINMHLVSNMPKGTTNTIINL